MTVKKANFEEMFQLSPDGTDYDLSQMAEDEGEAFLELDEDLDEEELMMVLNEDEVQKLLPGSNLPILDDDVEKEEPADWENAKDHAYFIVYMQDRLDSVPNWSGTTTVGCEKAISYMRKLDKELSDAIRSDDDNKIDEEEAEAIRDTIYNYIDRLEEAYDKLMGKYKKKAQLRVGKKVVARIKDGSDIQYFLSVGTPDGDETLLQIQLIEPTDEQVAQFVEGENLRQNMHKEAAGAVLFEDPFLHSITRMLIESHITLGKDLNEVYGEFKNKYDFTPREELSIHELLHQKGLPLIKDLGRLGENEVRPQDGLGVEHSTEYYA